AQRSLDFLEFVVRLHRNLFLDLPGDLFLGVMGLLFVAAIVSGIALYKPFARKIDFGEIRNRRGARIRWLDLHNLLGIVTLAWGLVVGVTGVVNELAVPLFGLWQKTDVKAMIEPYRGHQAPTLGELATVQGVFDTTRRELPGMVTSSVAFPGSPFGTPYHYMVWTKGNSPLTSRLFSPVLVDARTGAIQSVVKMPWYLSALEVSRPLHFGDYGGLPLKIIWALLDLVTIFVLGSGVYLWLSRRRSPIEERLAELQAAE
ncbi:MAG: PepSY domain-containing protein, partial [Proteobacteria bacterium]|nr:PepSY domain-containing protein [Pseudomonadota bacterium]